MIAQLHVSVARYDPEVDRSARWQTFLVRHEPGMMVQDALVQIRDEQDGSLRFREAEPGGFSGLGAVALNGRPVLAVREEMPSDNHEIRIGPLPNHGVIVDLVVDLEVGDHRADSLRPWLQRVSGVRDGHPSAMTREQLDRLQRSQFCNRCGICDGALRSTGPDFVGAAFLLKTYRLTADVRDDFDRERMIMAVGKNGLWRVDSSKLAGDCCPYGLEPFAQIDKLRRAAALNGFTDPG